MIFEIIARKTRLPGESLGEIVSGFESLLKLKCAYPAPVYFWDAS